MNRLRRLDQPTRLIASAMVLVVSSSLLSAPFWPQWALNPQHTGQVDVVGQALTKELADIVYDPLVGAERAANRGELQAHYQVPLIDSSSAVFMEFKSGVYNKNRFDTQIWGENGFRWINGQLVKVWTFSSDWKAPGSQADFWEPVFHGVLANGYIYVPGAGGTVFKLSKTDGTVISRINPFSTLDPTIIVAGVLTGDTAGNVYYNAIQQYNTGAGISFYAHDIVDSWLVRISPQDVATKVSYSVLTAATAANSLPSPRPTDHCLGVFNVKDLPFPPAPDAVPPSSVCGHMRPALNAAPAIGPDGTIYTITRIQLGDGTGRYAGMAAVNPNRTPPCWTRSKSWLVETRPRCC